MEFLSGKVGVPIHCWGGTRGMSDSVKEGSFPCNILYESTAVDLELRADRPFDVVIAVDEEDLMWKASCRVRKSDIRKGKEAPTIPRHD